MNFSSCGGNERCRPIFVGDADPAADDVLEEISLLSSILAVFDFLQAILPHDANQAFMQHIGGAGMFGLVEAGHAAIGGERNG